MSIDLYDPQQVSISKLTINRDRQTGRQADRQTDRDRETESSILCEVIATVFQYLKYTKK